MKAANTVYQSRIMPTFECCSLHLFGMTDTQSNKLESCYQKAVRIVSTNDGQSSVNYQRQQETCFFLRKIWSNKITWNFSVMEEIRKTTKRILKLKAKKRKVFYFTRAKLYSSLPLEACSLHNLNFINFIIEYFK